MADPILEAGGNNTDPSKLNPKLASLGLARELMNSKNPTVSIISDEFCLGQALMASISKFYEVRNENGELLNSGLNRVNEVFRSFEEHSPSIGGTGRQQVVECVVNNSRTIYQGMTPLAEENKPSAISRLIGFVSGNGGTNKQ